MGGAGIWRWEAVKCTPVRLKLFLPLVLPFGRWVHLVHDLEKQCQMPAVSKVKLCMAHRS